MRYFIDTEFAESPGRIDLISLGIVAEDGRELYAESRDFREDAANDWVKENVLPQLWQRQSNRFFQFHLSDGEGGVWSRSQIRMAVRLFIGDDKPEFWGYYADYDWVVFCWLFGAMVDLPKGWPMYCRDIKQWADQLGGVQLPKQAADEHHALADARWNKVAFDFLANVEASQEGQAVLMSEEAEAGRWYESSKYGRVLCCGTTSKADYCNAFAVREGASTVMKYLHCMELTEASEQRW